MGTPAKRMRTAPDVARELRIEAKRLRDWLRATYPRSDDLHGARWYLDEGMAAAARRHFTR